jgi:3-oxoacyl-[acyl-carrier protein] reductase
MRTIVVTGGGTGIGRAVAAVFVEAGDSVVITGRRRDVLAATAADLGARARWVAFDATDPAQVVAALDELPGAVDVLVNNAGGNTDITASAARATTAITGCAATACSHCCGTSTLRQAAVAAPMTRNLAASAASCRTAAK